MEDRRTFLNRILVASLRSYDIAGAYSDKLEPVERRLLKELLAPIPAGGIILDAGCGDGRLFALLAPSAGRLVGFDAHGNALLRARRRWPEVDFLVGDLRASPFRPGSFQAVVLSQVLEYIPPEERLPFLRRVADLLSSPGYLFISGERGPWWLLLRTFLTWRWLRRKPVVFGDYIYREREYGWQYHTLVSRRSLSRLLAQAGFRIDVLERDKGYVYALARVQGSTSQP